jgi:hypothetical protein
MIRAVEPLSGNHNKQSASHSYDEYVYSYRFYKILLDNLFNKEILNDQKNLSAYIDCGIFRVKKFEDERTKSENFLAFTKSKPISISEVDKYKDGKPIFRVDFNIKLSTKISSLGLDNYIDINENVGLVIWLMKDNYVFVSRYVISNCLLTDNYKIIELSEFMKVLKNPLDLL